MATLLPSTFRNQHRCVSLAPYSAFWRKSPVCLWAPRHLALSTPILVFHFFSRFLFHQFLWTSDFILAYCLLHFPFTSHKGQNAFFNRLQVAILSFLLISFLSETIFLRHALLLDVWSHALFFFFFPYTVIYFSKSSLFLLFLFYL